uniref:Succinate:cytochrome c oxidoreductase subunit 4 n=1 Tax=Sarcopeltis skottsbergii TaxID=2765380 RepID=A0A7M1VM15_SARSK|nr:succinate:cytochrome c oxidoreductase subunit 4 [Sarcopeltis skottsbergii]QOS04472.1 succinate:cytochrome c oxidoreductase subunit 4 [Sarcopeltis skottsbergii]
MFTLQWLVVRVVSLFVSLTILIDLEMLIVIFGFLIVHISIGLKTIIYDYIHFQKIKLILLILVRISAIEISRYTLELFI